MHASKPISHHAASGAPARHTAERFRGWEEGCKTRGFVYKNFNAGPSFTPQHTTGETEPTTHKVVWSLGRSVEVHPGLPAVDAGS